MNEWAEFRHFLYLLTVLEKGGFRPAAEHLHTSQPNLTIQARQFQDYASIRLYKKAGDGRIYPTETGLAFVPLAKELLALRDEVLAALGAIERGEIETIRFGCCSLVEQELFRLLCSLHREMLPRCVPRFSHGDTVHLAEALLAGELDAALVLLPLRHPELLVHEVRQDRLVVCLRRDDALAKKAAIDLEDMQDNLTIFYHPQRHPMAHARLMGLLNDVGLHIGAYSSASHPAEVQMLVREGHGLALVREGMHLDELLTTRPVQGVDWTVGTAIAFHRERHPKTIPLVVRKLRKVAVANTTSREKALFANAGNERALNKPSQVPTQLHLLR